MNGDGKREDGGVNGRQQGMDHACGRHGLVVVERVCEPWGTAQRTSGGRREKGKGEKGCGEKRGEKSC